MADERQGQEEFNKAVVEKIQSDPDFLGHLLENPQTALEGAGLSDAASATEEQEGQLEEGDATEGEVAGHRYHNYVTYYWTCRWIIYPYRYHRR